MPPSEPSRVFISYAHEDGAALAQQLQQDLNEKASMLGSTPSASPAEPSGRKRSKTLLINRTIFSRC
jgi:hypothetical protein